MTMAKKTAAKKTITVRFAHEKETKRAHQYKEVDDKGNTLEIKDAKVGSVYFKKADVGETPPDIITGTFTIG
jgi:hypothetical protein